MSFPITPNTRRILKNSIWLGTAEVVTKIISVVQTIEITRYLGSQGYGIYSFAVSFVSLFTILADFGFGTLLVRDISRDRSLTHHYLANLGILKFLLSTITFCLIFGTTIFLNKPPDIISFVLLSGAGIILQNILYFIHMVYRAFEKMELEAFSKIAYSAAIFIFIQYVVLKHLGISELLWVFIWSALLVILFNVAVMRHNLSGISEAINFRSWPGFIRQSGIFALSAAVMYIYFRIDVTILSFITSDSTVGIYSAAYNFVLMINMLPSIILPAIFPSLSRGHTTKGKNTKLIFFRTTSLLGSIGILLLIAFTLFPELIIRLVYGGKYIISAPTIITLILASVFMLVDRPGIDLLNATNRQGRNLIYLGICAVINISLNLILIPRFMDFGAALATLVTEITLTIFVIREAVRYFRNSDD